MHRSARGERKRGTVTEAHDDVRTLPRPTDQARQLRPEGCDFDRLVDGRVLEAERRCLQGEALAGASDADPVVRIGLPGDKDGNAR